MGVGGNVTDDLIDRLEASCHNTVALAEKTSLDMELVIVEWNTPMSYLNIRKSVTMRYVRWPKTDIPIRIIHTGLLHNEVYNPHNLKYLEWEPKNIGIRRAKGEFVLSTNPDDIFTEEMFAFFAEKKLQYNHFYRADRHDYRDGSVYMVCKANGTHWPGLTEEQMHAKTGAGAVNFSPVQIHYCAAGDFTLMSKQDWFRIHGNPELGFNHTIDGQTLHLAQLAGMRQVVLPYPIYHPDHARTLNEGFYPSWNDAYPHSTMNDIWGFPEKVFSETLVSGDEPAQQAILPTMPEIGAPCWMGWPEPRPADHVLIRIVDERLRAKNGEFAYVPRKYVERYVSAGQALIAE
jgi:hypothetical protein